MIMNKALCSKGGRAKKSFRDLGQSSPHNHPLRLHLSTVTLLRTSHLSPLTTTAMSQPLKPTTFNLLSGLPIEI